MDIKKILAVVVMWGGYGMAADAAGDEFEIVKTPEDPVDAILTRLAALEETNTRLFRRLSARTEELSTRTDNLEATGAIANGRMDFYSRQIERIADDTYEGARNLVESTAALEGAQATATRQIIDLRVEDARLSTRMGDWEARLRAIADQQAALAHRNQAALARHEERLDGHDARLNDIERHIAVLYNSDQANRAAIAPIPHLQRIAAEILPRQVGSLQAQMVTLQQEMRDLQLQSGVRARK